MKDKEKFCEELNNLMEYMFRREQEIRSLNIDEEDIVLSPSVKGIMSKMYMSEFVNSTKDRVRKVINYAGIDLNEYTAISSKQEDEKISAIKKHREWYKSQEFDI